MLVVGSRLIGAPVMSVHVGGEIARTKRAVVDPEDLKVIAYELSGPLLRGLNETIMRTDDVREYGRLGLIIDSRDELVAREDVVRINEVMGLRFDLVGLKVVTKKGKRVGRVTDFLMDSQSFLILKLVVQRPITMAALLDSELMIERTEIVEVTDDKIIIKDHKAKVKSKAKASKKDFVPNFVNPFREPALSASAEVEKEGRG